MVLSDNKNFKMYLNSNNLSQTTFSIVKVHFSKVKDTQLFILYKKALNFNFYIVHCTKEGMESVLSVFE